jgi:hypothetical protein
MPSWLSPAKRLIRNQQIEGSNPSDGLCFSKKQPKHGIDTSGVLHFSVFRRFLGFCFDAHTKE